MSVPVAGAHFLSVDRPDFDDSLGCRVLYLTGDPVTFSRRDFPSHVPMQLPACAASFATELTLPEFEDPEFPDLNPSPTEWNLLLDSSMVTHMGWAGGRMLQWLIESDRLQARDFSRVQATLLFL